MDGSLRFIDYRHDRDGGCSAGLLADIYPQAPTFERMYQDEFVRGPRGFRERRWVRDLRLKFEAEQDADAPEGVSCCVWSRPDGRYHDPAMDAAWVAVQAARVTP